MSSSARPDESPSTVQRTEEVVEVTAGDFYFVAFLVLTALVVLALTALSF